MEEKIKEALVELLRCHVATASENDIDDNFLSYVSGILEDLVDEENPEQNFDVESFMEMILAYLPQLQGIEEATVTEWMLKLVDNVNNSTKQQSSSSFDIKSLILETTSKQPVKKTRSVSETSEPEQLKKKRSGRVSETSDTLDEAVLEAGVATLLEMFPNCCKVEAVHCLTIMAGDMERAAQMLLTRAETGEDIKLSQAQLLAQLNKPVKVDESEIKRKIMDNYGFVDTEHDTKYHRPIISKKNDDKKLIRYREGKIVSTKGERFSQVTKEESQEMKKSIKI